MNQREERIRMGRTIGEKIRKHAAGWREQDGARIAIAQISHMIDGDLLQGVVDGMACEWREGPMGNVTLEVKK